MIRPNADRPASSGTHRARRAALSVEAQLLMHLVADESNDTELRAFANRGVDWDRLLRLARNEAAVSVIYPRLCRAAADVVPGGVLEQMRRVAKVGDFALLYLESRLRESVGALARAGVPVMLLKGAALAYGVYGDFRRRPMSDIDMLVEPRHAATAYRLMLETGWHEIAEGVPDDVYASHQHLPPLEDARSSSLQLEVHTALFPRRQPFALHTEDLWSRAQPVAALAGASVPAAVDSLLYACLHFFWSHSGEFGAWRTVRDVEAITRRAEFDWDDFVRRARDARGATLCYWTLRIAQSTLDAPPPILDDVLAELAPRRNARLLRALEYHFLANLFGDRARCPSITLSRVLWELGVMPRRCGHGDIRPWDADDKFVRAGESQAPKRPSSRRLRTLLAAPSYVGRLLSTAV